MKKPFAFILLIVSLFIISSCHNNDNWEYDDLYHWHVSNSGTLKDKEEHTFDNGVVTKEATIKDCGEMTYTCTVCGKTKIEQVDKVAHNHVYSGEWKTDSLYHYKECECGERSEIDFHDYIESGDELICSVCGHIKEEKNEYKVKVSYDKKIAYHLVTIGDASYETMEFTIGALKIIDFMAAIYESKEDNYHIEKILINGKEEAFQNIDFYVETYITVDRDLLIEVVIGDGPYEPPQLGPDDGVLLSIQCDEEIVFISAYIGSSKLSERELYVLDGSEVFMLIGFRTGFKKEYTYEVLINGIPKELNLVGSGHELVFTIDGDTLVEVVLHSKEEVNTEPINYETREIIEDASIETLSTFAKKEGLPCGFNSIGDVEVLVIPIAFNNSPEYDLSIIDKAFNGTKEDTGWNSLHSYYYESSYGKLNLSANILSPYETGIDYNPRKGYVYDEDDNDQDFNEIYDYRFLTEALDYYDNLGFDFSKYDSNDDGRLDTVYLIYLAPYDDTGRSDIWWAYNWLYLYDDDHVYDGLSLDFYIWMSIEFFDSPINYQSTYLEEEYEYVDINCETLIHETGHSLGLEDYYDIDGMGFGTGGLGGLNMMDSNQGDHDPFSKALLGWINPDIVYGKDYGVTLNSFSETGDSVFITRSNNGTYFDEFYIISYYTPDGLNEYKALEDGPLYDIDGIIIYHVNSILKDDYKTKEFVIDIYKYNNSGRVNRLIEIIPHGDNNIDKTMVVDNSDLYLEGDSFANDIFGFTINVISINDNSARVSITFEE